MISYLVSEEKKGVINKGQWVCRSLGVEEKKLEEGNRVLVAYELLEHYRSLRSSILRGISHVFWPKRTMMEEKGQEKE
ncbi:hypothetical protein CEXT_345951 [Caerostris extrusa]|uniref:Uncharacterized protein n=1 Tax=Caerostris extrusa TaxID=172846 RepID=A0AAV4M8A8_CAEEX|nr:hypothetical protein CEXT_345951 [Caerostris extrusa]